MGKGMRVLHIEGVAMDFLGFSYGFRPGRSGPDAMDALATGIYERRVNWVLDAGIRDTFGQVDQAWLERFLEHRIADRRVLRLIQRWLRAGVIEQGEWSQTERGGVQGASGFEQREDAERFLADLRRRLAQFGLELGQEKTRLIEFGRFAARDRDRRGDRKPDTFEFLEFTHICAASKTGRFKLKRVPSQRGCQRGATCLTSSIYRPADADASSGELPDWRADM